MLWAHPIHEGPSTTWQFNRVSGTHRVDFFLILQIVHTRIKHAYFWKLTFASIQRWSLQLEDQLPWEYQAVGPGSQLPPQLASDSSHSMAFSVLLAPTRWHQSCKHRTCINFRKYILDKRVLYTLCKDQCRAYHTPVLQRKVLKEGLWKCETSNSWGKIDQLTCTVLVSTQSGGTLAKHPRNWLQN
jgi:hypothetical protein